MVQVQVKAPIHATEVADRVAQAVLRFLPDGQVEVGAAGVVARGHDLGALRKRVWELRIIDTFRSALLAGCKGDTLRFTLSKQAAFAGRVSLPAAPHALGDLAWTVRLDETDPWDDAEALSWWLCPETKDGEIVGPTGPGDAAA